MTKRLCCQSVAECINSAGYKWSQTSFSCFVIWCARPHFYQLSSQYKWRIYVFAALHRFLVSAYSSTVCMCVCMFIFVCEPIIIPLVLHLPYAWLLSNLLCMSGWQTHTLFIPLMTYLFVSLPPSLPFLSYASYHLVLNRTFSFHFSIFHYFPPSPLKITHSLSVKKSGCVLYRTLKEDYTVLCTKTVLLCVCTSHYYMYVYNSVRIHLHLCWEMCLSEFAVIKFPACLQAASLKKRKLHSPITTSLKQKLHTNS